MLSVAGSLRPRKTLTRRGVAEAVWDGGTSVDATVRLANAEIADVLQMAGEQQKIAVTGKVTANAQVRGTLGNMDGQGRISLAKGVAYGEPYDSAVANLAVRGQEIDAGNAVLVMHGARIAGEGGYDLQTKHVHGHIEGDNLVMSKFKTFAKASPNADGTLTLAADANGTMEQPGLKATATLTGVVLDGKPLGDIAAQAHSQGSELLYTVQSTLVGAKIDGSGQTGLTGNYETQNRLAFSGFDMGTALEMFMPGRVKAQSSIDGVVTVSGPLKAPTRLSGAAELSNFDVKLQGVELKDAGADAREPEGRGCDAGADAYCWRRHGHAGQRNRAGVRRDGYRRREAGCKGQRKCERCDCAYLRPGYSVEREGGVHSGGGRAGGEAVADWKGEVRRR